MTLASPLSPPHLSLAQTPAFLPAPVDDVPFVSAPADTWCVAVWRKGQEREVEALQVVSFRADNSFNCLHYAHRRIESFAAICRAQKQRRGFQLERLQFAYGESGLSRELNQVYRDLHDAKKFPARRARPDKTSSSTRSHHHHKGN